LRATLACIEANPGLWEQGSWLDCFAAYAVELAGYDVLPSLWVRLPHRSVQVWDAAVEVLDLTGDQARALFASDNSLADLRTLVAEITRPRCPARHARDRHLRHLRLVG
jgi:hypothetical protein